MLHVSIRADTQTLYEAAEKFDVRFLYQYDVLRIVQVVYNQHESWVVDTLLAEIECSVSLCFGLAFRMKYATKNSQLLWIFINLD